MKLLLSLLLVISIESAPTFVEMVNYRMFVDRTSADFEKDLNALEKEYEKNGCSDAVLIKSGFFTKKYARQFMAIRQMEVYSQNILIKSLSRMTPFLEKIGNDVVKVYVSSKK